MTYLNNDIYNILHYIDFIPFALATFLIVIGTAKADSILKIMMVITAIVYIVAQSSWFSAFMTGDLWGRDWANVLWFIFNTNVMVIFLCILFKQE